MSKDSNQTTSLSFVETEMKDKGFWLLGQPLDDTACRDLADIPVYRLERLFG